MKFDNGWTFLLCHDCGKKIPPRCAHRPFPGAYLCDDCVDDLFLTSTEVWPCNPVPPSAHRD